MEMARNMERAAGGGKLNGIWWCCSNGSSDQLNASPEAQGGQKTNLEIGLTMLPPDKRCTLRMKKKKKPNAVFKTEVAQINPKQVKIWVLELQQMRHPSAPTGRERVNVVGCPEDWSLITM